MRLGIEIRLFSWSSSRVMSSLRGKLVLGINSLYKVQPCPGFSRHIIVGVGFHV